MAQTITCCACGVVPWHNEGILLAFWANCKFLIQGPSSRCTFAELNQQLIIFVLSKRMLLIQGLHEVSWEGTYSLMGEIIPLELREVGVSVVSQNRNPLFVIGATLTRKRIALSIEISLHDLLDSGVFALWSDPLNESDELRSALAYNCTRDECCNLYH